MNKSQPQSTYKIKMKAASRRQRPRACLKHACCRMRDVAIAGACAAAPAAAGQAALPRRSALPEQPHSFTVRASLRSATSGSIARGAIESPKSAAASSVQKYAGRIPRATRRPKHRTMVVVRVRGACACCVARAHTNVNVNPIPVLLFFSAHVANTPAGMDIPGCVHAIFAPPPQKN